MRVSAGEGVAAAAPGQFSEELGRRGMRVHGALLGGRGRRSWATVHLTARAPVQKSGMFTKTANLDRVTASRATLSISAVDSKARTA